MREGVAEYYVLSGPYSHWLYGLQHRVWGVDKSVKKQVKWWKMMKADDKVILYCTGIGVVIGIGNVVGTREKQELWWPREEDENRNIYQYIIDLAELELLVDPKDGMEAWGKAGISDYHSLEMNIGHFQMGLCRLVKNRDVIFDLTKNSVEAKLQRIDQKDRVQEFQKVVKTKPDHDLIRDTIVDVGKLLAYSALSEYPIDSKRLDAIWKRVPQGNPTHAFEVQIGGNFFEAMTKLKHAWDIWNSTPVLITTEEYRPEAENWLSGSFHEISHVVRVVKWQDVLALANLLRDVKAIKDTLDFW